MKRKSVWNTTKELRCYCCQKKCPAYAGIGDAEILDELSSILRHLQPSEKVRLLTLVSANFGENIRKETKKC